MVQRTGTLKNLYRPLFVIVKIHRVKIPPKQQPNPQNHITPAISLNTKYIAGLDVFVQGLQKLPPIRLSFSSQNQAAQAEK